MAIRKPINLQYNIDFFIAKIDEAKAFKPNPEQIELYNKFRGLLQADRAIVNKYINDNNPNFNQTDRQRVRMYRAVLNNNIEGYRSYTIITEKEFEENFRFQVAKWDELVMQMRLHYGFEGIK